MDISVSDRFPDGSERSATVRSISPENETALWNQVVGSDRRPKFFSPDRATKLAYVGIVLTILFGVGGIGVGLLCLIPGTFPKSSLPDWLATTGLILDAIGIVLLFRFAPEKYPDPQSTVFFALEDNSRIRWKKAQRLRKRIAHWSLTAIVIGFALQCVAIVFW